MISSLVNSCYQFRRSIIVQQIRKIRNVSTNVFYRPNAGSRVADKGKVLYESVLTTLEQTSWIVVFTWVNTFNWNDQVTAFVTLSRHNYIQMLPICSWSRRNKEALTLSGHVHS